MKTSKELKALQKQRGLINDQIWKIEVSDRIKENSSQVGKHFVYDNGYNNEERWPMYTKVLSINDDGWFKTFCFQISLDGKATAETVDHAYSTGLEKEITETEFWSAYGKFLDRLVEMTEGAK